jgi:hypothetical protein
MNRLMTRPAPKRRSPGTSSSTGPAAATRRFREAYFGHYSDRAAFGQELAGLGADGRLQRLPDWLRAYVRLDGAAVVADFEAAGHFYVYDAPEGGGTYVFDGFR